MAEEEQRLTRIARELIRGERPEDGLAKLARANFLYYVEDMPISGLNFLFLQRVVDKEIPLWVPSLKFSSEMERVSHGLIIKEGGCLSIAVLINPQIWQPEPYLPTIQKAKQSGALPQEVQDTILYTVSMIHQLDNLTSSQPLRRV
jgi:hypothetical protein